MSEKQKSDRKMSTKRKIGMQKRLKRKKRTAKMSTKKHDCKPESVQMWKEDFILCGAANILLSSFCLRNWTFLGYFCKLYNYIKRKYFNLMKKGTFLFKFYLTYFINTCNTALFNFPSFFSWAFPIITIFL